MNRWQRPPEADAMSEPQDRQETGLLLGKFLPPHRGHQYLVDFARRYADHVTVHVCSVESECIPGALRYSWVRDHFSGCPNVTVVHCDDPNPQTPEESPDHFWEIWRESLFSRMDRAPDLVFASEPYGFRLAETLGARYVPVDHAREMAPISGTLLRSDPLRYWDYLLPPARPYFAKRIALVGPESSGKTTLTAFLTRHFEATFAMEYARGYLEAVPAHWLTPAGDSNGFNEEALIAILRGQRASVDAMALQCRGLLFSDTEAIVTACWSQVLLGYVPPLAERYILEQQYDLYLVTAASEGWDPDGGQRVQPEYAERKRFEDAVVARLEAHRYPYVILRGSWEEREQQAVEAVRHVLRSSAPFRKG